MNPLVRDYLLQKQEERKRLEAESAPTGLQNVGSMLAAAGAGFMGRDPLQAGMALQGQQQQRAQKALSDFDQASNMELKGMEMDRAIGLENKKIEREDEIYNKQKQIEDIESDPESFESKTYQQIASKMMPNTDFSGLSATKIKSFLPGIQDMYKLEESKYKADLYNQGQLLDRELKLKQLQDLRESRESSIAERQKDRELNTQKMQLELQKAQREEKEKERAYQDAIAKDQRESDPSSDESRVYQGLANKLVPGDYSNLPVKRLKDIFPTLQKVYESQINLMQKEQDREFKAIEQEKDKSFKKELLDQQQKFQADQNRMNRGLKNKEIGYTEGQKVLDREFAKDYNEWQSRGRTSYQKNRQLLEQSLKTLEKRKNDIVGTSGRITGRLPDWMRSEESKRLEQDVRQSAQGALRATLGAQFTEKEGERIMQTAYDPKLSPAENIRKIKLALSELDSMAQLMDARAQEFSKKGTLREFSPPPSVPQMSKPGVGASGLTPEQRKARIEELRRKKGAK